MNLQRKGLRERGARVQLERQFDVRSLPVRRLAQRTLLRGDSHAIQLKKSRLTMRRQCSGNTDHLELDDKCRNPAKRGVDSEPVCSGRGQWYTVRFPFIE